MKLMPLDGSYTEVMVFTSSPPAPVPSSSSSSSPSVSPVSSVLLLLSVYFFRLGHLDFTLPGEHNSSQRKGLEPKTDTYTLVALSIRPDSVKVRVLGTNMSLVEFSIEVEFSANVFTTI